MLKQHSYYKTGGSCASFFAPKSLEELASGFQEILKSKMPFFLLGLGSNSLVLDEPWNGAVISFKNLTELAVNQDQKEITALAGVINSELAAKAFASRLPGLSFMNGLPGQLGATVRMNARCYGSEISTFVSKVTVVNFQSGQLESFDTRSDHDKKKVFKGYKDTLLMDTKDLVAQVTLYLPGAFDAPHEQSVMDNCLKDRTDKGQYLFPSCGCVFKNDYSEEVSISSGMLLERSGAKSLKKGGATVSPFHGNFVYNKDNATSRDILELSFLMQELVYDNFGVWLSYEMEVLGELPPDLKKRFYEVRPPMYHKNKLSELRKEFKKRS